MADSRNQPAAAHRNSRLPAIDAMRGIVMVLMALDHASHAFNAGRYTIILLPHPCSSSDSRRLGAQYASYRRTAGDLHRRCSSVAGALSSLPLVWPCQKGPSGQSAALPVVFRAYNPRQADFCWKFQFQMALECPSSSRRGVTSPRQVGVLEYWRDGKG